MHIILVVPAACICICAGPEHPTRIVTLQTGKKTRCIRPLALATHERVLAPVDLLVDLSEVRLNADGRSQRQGKQDSVSACSVLSASSPAALVSRSKSSSPARCTPHKDVAVGSNRSADAPLPAPPRQVRRRHVRFAALTHFCGPCTQALQGPRRGRQRTEGVNERTLRMGSVCGRRGAGLSEGEGWRLLVIGASDSPTARLA